MALFATAGMKLYIGGVIDDKDGGVLGEEFTIADFTSQVWTQINGVESMGSLGDSSETMQFWDIGSNRVKQVKGGLNGGTTEIVCGIDYADAGQAAAIAAQKEIHNYAFRIVFNDAPPGGTPSERLFIALVISQSEQYDTANSVMKLNLSLAVNSNAVRIDAAA